MRRIDCTDEIDMRILERFIQCEYEVIQIGLSDYKIMVSLNPYEDNLEYLVICYNKEFTSIHHYTFSKRDYLYELGKWIILYSEQTEQFVIAQKAGIAPRKKGNVSRGTCRMCRHLTEFADYSGYYSICELNNVAIGYPSEFHCEKFEDR